MARNLFVGPCQTGYNLSICNMGHNLPKCKGSFTIIDIYESVQRVLFLMTPSPLPQSVLENVDFVKVLCINWNMHRLRILLNSIHHALIVSHLPVHNHKQNYCNSENIHLFIIKLQVALHRSTLKRVKMHVAAARCEGPL